MRGKYLFGLLDGKGGLKVYSSNSSRKLKTKRSLMTKDKHYLEVSRILKSDKPLPAMFTIRLTTSEAIA